MDNPTTFIPVCLTIYPVHIEKIPRILGTQNFKNFIKSFIGFSFQLIKRSQVDNQSICYVDTLDEITVQKNFLIRYIWIFQCIFLMGKGL
ncbi:hypothetical protein DSECCO2_99720 [anaerobic digester metagenome]